MGATISDLVFVGLNSRVAALRQQDGEILWQWRAPKPKTGGYVSLLLLDDKRLIASVNGYTYCIDPRSGEERWFNELAGFGTGVTSIVAAGKHNPHDSILAAAAATQSAASGAGAGAGA
jgi:outer membrane protein assembly factor BamB